MIRHAETGDLEKLLYVYAAARKYMRDNGNPGQWGTTYPPMDLIEADIRARRLYLLEEDGVIHAAFAFIFGDDPTYARIEDGTWPNAEPYATIHRVASDGMIKGVFKKCLDYCKKHSDNLRIDTHENNKAMQHVIEKNGFKRCGIIYFDDGSPRTAYQWTAPSPADILFTPLCAEHKKGITDIYNGYILAGTAAFPQEPVSDDFFDFLFEMDEKYPAFVLLDQESSQIAGFWFLSSYHPQPTFSGTAVIDSFLAPGYTGRGLGAHCLQRLEQAAKNAGVRHLIADVSTENQGSISFHLKHGFRQCGVLEDIGYKLGRSFGVTILQKDL